MSLAAHIKAQQTTNTPTCKTCIVLALLDDEDRADFTAAVAQKVQAAPIARAVNIRLGELGEEMSVGEGSVRTHISKGCRP